MKTEEQILRENHPLRGALDHMDLMDHVSRRKYQKPQDVWIDKDKWIPTTIRHCPEPGDKHFWLHVEAGGEWHNIVAHKSDARWSKKLKTYRIRVTHRIKNPGSNYESQTYTLPQDPRHDNIIVIDLAPKCPSPYGDPKYTYGSGLL